jgi:hypothetical protein
VLWVLVIMVLAASAFSLWVDKARTQAAERQQTLEAKRRASDLLAKVLYTQLTGMKGAEGVAWPGLPGEVVAPASFDSLDDFMSGAPPRLSSNTAAGLMPLDGTVLDAGEGLRVMIQDRGGLIGLSFLEGMDVFRGVAGLSKQAEISAERLRDTLFDYQDPNGYRRPLGAESHQYNQAGMSPPLDGFLRHPLSLREVMVWNQVLADKSDAWLLGTFREEGDGNVNVNTAPPSVLELLVPAPAALNAILERRKKGPFTSVNQLHAFGDVGGEDPPFTIVPSSGIRFWWWRENDHTAQVYDVQFSPLNSGRDAWYFNWTTRVALPDDLAKSTATATDHPFFR